MTANHNLTGLNLLSKRQSRLRRSVHVAYTCRHSQCIPNPCDLYCLHDDLGLLVQAAYALWYNETDGVVRDSLATVSIRRVSKK